MIKLRDYRFLIPIILLLELAPLKNIYDKTNIAAPHFFRVIAVIRHTRVWTGNGLNSRHPFQSAGGESIGKGERVVWSKNLLQLSVVGLGFGVGITRSGKPGGKSPALIRP